MTCGLGNLVDRERDEILRIAARHGAANVRMFGSLTRGEGNAESDIDLLVDMQPEHSSFFPGGLVADLQDLLGRDVHVVTEDALHWSVRESVLKKAVKL